MIRYVEQMSCIAAESYEAIRIGALERRPADVASLDGVADKPLGRDGQRACRWFLFRSWAKRAITLILRRAEVAR